MLQNVLVLSPYPIPEKDKMQIFVSKEKSSVESEKISLGSKIKGVHLYLRLIQTQNTSEILFIFIYLFFTSPDPQYLLESLVAART